MEEEMMDSTENPSHWDRSRRMGLQSFKISWIFKLTFFYFFVLFISSLLPTTNAKIPRNSFSDSFSYLDLEPDNDVVDLDSYSFKSAILEYRTVFVYFNFENNRKHFATMQALELVAQLLSNKNVLVAKVTDKQFAETLGVTESGSYIAYHNGVPFPFYGYPTADVIIHFILKIKEPVVKEINNKETKIAFDKVDVPTFVGYFEEENEEYSVFEEAALSYLPYVQFYATFDETVASHLRLTAPGTYRYRRPLQHKSFLLEEALQTVEEVQQAVEKYKLGPLVKFSLRDIYHPWNKEESEEEFLAFMDYYSPRGKTFHKVLTKFLKEEMEKPESEYKVTWIDPSQFPTMIPVWENKYDITLDEPHFGHITESEVRWLEIPRLQEFEEKSAKISILKKWIRNEEDPYTPEEPEPEETVADVTEETTEDVKEEEGEGEKEKEAEESEESCSSESDCSSSDGTSESEETESETEEILEEEERDVETAGEEAEEVVEENETVENTEQAEAYNSETIAAEEEFAIEEEWVDYFDRLEEMELQKDLEKKSKLKEGKKVVEKKPEPEARKEHEKTEKKEKKVDPPERKKNTSEKSGGKNENNIKEIEKTLNEINELVDTITNGNSVKEDIVKDSNSVLKKIEDNEERNETVPEPEAEETAYKITGKVIGDETSVEDVSTEEILQTAEEVFWENEALRQENVELKEELVEDDDEDDDEEEDEDEDDEIQSTKKGGDNLYKNENYATYEGDFEVLSESFENENKNEYDKYFDELENNKDKKPTVQQKVVPKPEKKAKHEEQNPLYKDKEDYGDFSVDMNVLVDSFEKTALQDEWTNYFDQLEDEENKRLNGKVKKKKGKRSGGGSSFFAEAMPMKDNRIKIKQFLEREKEKREKMKQKIDKDSIKNYINLKANGKRENAPVESNQLDEIVQHSNSEKKINENNKVVEIVKEDETIEKVQQEQESIEQKGENADSGNLQESLLQLLKDVETLLDLKGYTSGVTNTEAEGNENSATKDSVDQQEKEIENKRKKSKTKSEELNLFPDNVDITDPESIVNTIKHTTTVANKLMQQFADSLTDKLLKKGGGSSEDGEDDDEPWEVREERDEKLNKLCRKGKLSSADCNQVIHGRSMEHVHNFQKVKTPKVPRFKPSPPEGPQEEREPVTTEFQETPVENSEISSSETEDTKVTELSENMKTEETQQENTDSKLENSEKEIAVEVDSAKIVPNTEDVGEPTYEDEIMSETGTNFDETLLYDQSTLDKIEEEKFFYKFDDWDSPSSTTLTPTDDQTLDARSQIPADEQNAVPTQQENIAVEKIEHVDGDIESARKEEIDTSSNVKKEKEVKAENERDEGKNKKEGNLEKKKDKKDDNENKMKDKEKKEGKNKKCKCEKERKQLKNKKGKYNSEEEEEERKKDKYKDKESDICDCKWKILP